MTRETPSAPWLAIVVVTICLVLATRHEPRYELRGANESYGMILASDTNLLVTVDRDSDGFVLRFVRVDDGTVDESRIRIEGEVVSVDIRRDTAVAYVRGAQSEVRFYNRVNQGWSEAQRMTLPAECVDDKVSILTAVTLGDDVAVVASESLCVFERRGTWLLTNKLPSDIAVVRISGNRVFLMDLWTLDELVRDGASWTRRRRLTLPEGLVMFHNVDASDRWLAIRCMDNVLVYDLEHFDLATVIPLERFAGQDIGIGNRTLAYTLAEGSLAWCFDDGWHECGTLEGAHSTQLRRPIAIGNVVWIGNPVSEPDEIGRVLGYELPHR